MKGNLLLSLVFLLPVIPSVIYAMVLMGFGQASLAHGEQPVSHGMHPLAAAGWGFGVYFIILSLIGMIAILIEGLRNRSKSS